MSKSKSEIRKLKNDDDSEKERKIPIIIYLEIFYFCIRATLISRIFAISSNIIILFI